jgi:putative addiction module component (TIGR02574 family)
LAIVSSRCKWSPAGAGNQPHNAGIFGGGGLLALPFPVKFNAMNANLLEAPKALPLPERIDLAEALWESITDEGHEPPLSPAQANELDRRLEEHRRHPSTGIPWEQVKAELNRKYGSSK